MISLYNTLETHMHDANEISAAVQSLQNMKSNQIKFIKYGDLQEAEKCEVTISQLTIDLNDAQFFNQIDALLTQFSEQFHQLKMLRTQITDTETYLSSSLDALYNMIAVRYDDATQITHTDPISMLLLKSLITEQAHVSQPASYDLEALLPIKELIVYVHQVLDTDLQPQDADFYNTLLDVLNHYYALYDDHLMLNQNMVILSDQLDETTLELITTTTNTLNTYRSGNQEIILHIKNAYFLLFSSAFVITGFFILRLVFRITHALNTLTRETERVAEGDYNTFVIIEGNDEFAILSRSIAQMANQLKNAHFSILTYNKQLEHMVNAKTMALQRTKEELEHLNRTLTQEKEKYIILAMTDVLTNLKNRAFLLSYLEQTIHESKRYQTTFSIMLLDIDFFKKVNDQYGHPTGDAVLKALSDLLLTECRQSDVVSRYGGEEFVIIFAKTKLGAALPIANRIREKIAVTPLTEKNIVITISAGITAFRDDTVESLLKRVDTLQYDAKRNGRNRIETDFN